MSAFKLLSQSPPSLMSLVASVRNEFYIPRGQMCFKCDPLNFLFRVEGEQYTLEHPRLVEQRCAPNVRLFHVVLFPLESSYVDTMCYLEFQMVKLRNHSIKQKVLALHCDNLGHLGKGVWSNMFPNESGKENPEQICPRWAQHRAPLAFVAPLHTSKCSCGINADAWVRL